MKFSIIYYLRRVKCKLRLFNKTKKQGKQLTTSVHTTGPLHIPAKRPGFDADPSVIRHPHPWSSYESAAGYDTQYHSQYILERDRKPLYYGYPDPQFSQVIITRHKNLFSFFRKNISKNNFLKYLIFE